jgi:hypothetical protein
MRTQDRRLKELETIAGTGTEGITLFIREICRPSATGDGATGEFYGTRIGAGGRIRNLPGESIEGFKRRLMEMEVKQ